MLTIPQRQEGQPLMFYLNNLIPLLSTYIFVYVYISFVYKHMVFSYGRTVISLLMCNKEDSNSIGDSEKDLMNDTTRKDLE